MRGLITKQIISSKWHILSQVCRELTVICRVLRNRLRGSYVFFFFLLGVVFLPLMLKSTYDLMPPLETCVLIRLKVFFLLFS